MGGRVGGGRVGEKKTKLMLYSTQLKLKLKLELSLAKNLGYKKQAGAELKKKKKRIFWP